MDPLAALKSACILKTFQSFKDLPLGEYVVYRFAVVDTDHGTKVRIDLAETYMYLPERFVNALADTSMEALNQKPKIMIYKGKDTKHMDRLILDFKDVD